MGGNKTLTVQGVEIHLISKDDEDYISLTDMVQGFDGQEQLIKNWLQNQNTIEFLSVWERLNNPNFNLVELHQIKSEIGLNRFVMSAKKWAEKTNAIGIVARAGRYGGTFAHKDIAFEFGSWLSPEFKLYLIKEFQRLKDAEAQSGQLEWNIRRTLVKANYRIHTDAIKANLIPPAISKAQEGFVYANEADLLNKALFGMTAKEWREKNSDKTDGNIRDYATIEQLVVMASLESQNALLIQQGHDASTRLSILNQLAISQLRSLLGNVAVKKLENPPLLDDKK